MTTTKSYLIIFFILIITLFGCKNKEVESELNILVNVPLTGDAASYGKTFQQGIDLALDEIKNIDEKSFQLINIIYADNKLSATEAVNILQQESAKRQISAVLPVSTHISMALAPICNSKKILLLPPIADGDTLATAGEYCFRISPSSSFQGKILGEKIIEMNLANISIIYIYNIWGIGLANTVRNTLVENGKTINSFESCTPGQRDFRTILTKIKRHNSDAIVIFVHPAETIPLLKQIKEFGMKSIIFGGDTFSNKSLYQDEFLSLLKGVIFALPASPTNIQFEKFSSKYQAKYEVKADINAAAAYDAVLLLYEAMKRGNTTGNAIKNYFNNMSEGYIGATGLIIWDENGSVISKTYDLFTVRNEPYYERY